MFTSVFFFIEFATLDLSSVSILAQGHGGRPWGRPRPGRCSVATLRARDRASVVLGEGVGRKWSSQGTPVEPIQAVVSARWRRPLWLWALARRCASWAHQRKWPCARLLGKLYRCGCGRGRGALCWPGCLRGNGRQCPENRGAHLASATTRSASMRVPRLPSVGRSCHL